MTNLFIRCEWLPTNKSKLEDRLEEALMQLRKVSRTQLFGVQWFWPGASKVEALENPVNLKELTSKHWLMIPIIKEQVMYRLAIWNGKEGYESCKLSATLNIPSEGVDKIVVSVDDINWLRSSGAKWENVLELAESLAIQLGGISIVSSIQLRNWSKEQQLANVDRAAYALFWGVDRSMKNPKFNGLQEAGRTPPYEFKACRSWEEVDHPDTNRIQNTIRLSSSNQI